MRRSVIAKFRTTVFAAAALAAAAAAWPAAALELETLRAGGARLSAALELGRANRWEDAEAEIALLGDPLLADVLRWRKLRAGDGTVEEYSDFVARRGNWPGQAALRGAVFGDSGSGGGGSLMSGAALEAWQAFDRAWRSRDWLTAESVILAASTSAAGLGDPERWGERRRSLVRRAQREGRYQSAYQMASRHFLTTGRSFADLEWLAGWIALRYLDDADSAATHFLQFRTDVVTPISLGRAGYWIGRAFEAKGEPGLARHWYNQGAQHLTSFYGQLSAAKLNLPGDPAIAGGTAPDWRTTPALQTDAVRAALLIYYAGERNLAQQFFHHLARELPAPDGVGALASLALELGEYSFAVRIAKISARRGHVLHHAYYPVHPLAQFERGVEPALAMSIARQETELDPRAISPAGARGLMQLMPGTARLVAGQLGMEYDRARLTTDWQYNAVLGQRYLADQILRFGGSYAMAAAAYNAGPHRVDQWIAEYGDPRFQTVDLIDWLETIPFEETRNYVQRIMEGLYVYRSRISGVAGPMTIMQDLARGRY